MNNIKFNFELRHLFDLWEKFCSEEENATTLLAEKVGVPEAMVVAWLNETAEPDINTQAVLYRLWNFLIYRERFIEMGIWDEEAFNNFKKANDYENLEALKVRFPDRLNEDTFPANSKVARMRARRCEMRRKIQVLPVCKRQMEALRDRIEHLSETHPKMSAKGVAQLKKELQEKKRELDEFKKFLSKNGVNEQGKSK